jgi:hypothetical protein
VDVTTRAAPRVSVWQGTGEAWFSEFEYGPSLAKGHPVTQPSHKPQEAPIAGAVSHAQPRGAVLLELLRNAVQRRGISVDRVDGPRHRNRITAEHAANRDQRVQQPRMAAAAEQHQSFAGVLHQGKVIR